MYEFMKVSYTSEVKNGKVCYFKEYTEQENHSIVFRQEIPERDFIEYEISKAGRKCDDVQTENLVKAICDMINYNGIRFEAFYRAMRFEHRALQGDFANLVIRWIIDASSEPEKYGFDDRNKLIKIAGEVLRTRF